MCVCTLGIKSPHLCLLNIGTGNAHKLIVMSQTPLVGPPLKIGETFYTLSYECENSLLVSNPAHTVCHSTQWSSDIQLEVQEEKHILTRGINTEASNLYFSICLQSGWLSLFHLLEFTWTRRVVSVVTRCFSSILFWWHTFDCWGVFLFYSMSAACKQ